MSHIWDHLDHILDILAVAVPAFWWLRRWTKRIELTVSFTKDVATEHLPHIYWRLRRSDDAIKLPVVEHPSIVYRPVNGNGVHASKEGTGA